MLKRMASLLVALAIGLASVLASIPARAQAPYPNRPIRIVIPFGPGGFADITVRLLGQKLTERTGAQVVIENRPGAGGIVAASSVLSSPADGYTLFVFSSGIALSKSLLKTMPFDPVTAFAPISTMALFDTLLLVKADSPIKTLKDALDAARVDPQKFNVATINPGSTQNVTGELLRAATGIPMTVVPHRTTGEVLTSLLRGDTQLAVDALAPLKAAVDDKQIRAIASSGSKRSPQLPDVPTMRELGIDAVVDGWNSLVAPAGTPREIISYLNGHVRAIVADGEFQKRMIDLGGEPASCSPEELDARLKADVEMWAAIVKKAGLSPN
ncbi:MAG: tripartite tricarboxylate transporter substrate binding protein [Bradyrhizobium sp.]|nr:tripartite tricarboxylate transporter substrate binding protein [Bradyrhizobium sp.]